ncbi:MAG TPA: hypothetical protein VFI42_09770 [Thermomicrobiaceae bacterium]|nr:hypothetical protein [Thermomicrobiaceae bacterium]
MRDPGLDIFQQTLEGLEQGLSVRHIASFDLKCCSIDDQVAAVCDDRRFRNFDQAPVERDGRIVGVLEFSNRGKSGTVVEHMRPLDDSMLVSAAEPLASYVRHAGDSDYRLVLQGISIRGIVTRTDLLKLPVRLFIFGLVTHLEAVMSRIIRRYYPEPELWLPFLTDDRQERVLEKVQKRDKPLLELAEFCDKRTIVHQHFNLSNKFESDLKHVEKLRNTVAHGSSYAETEEELQAFVEYVRVAERWIKDLKERIPPASEDIDQPNQV